MRMYYVYGLVDPVSHLVRYVGLTTRPIEERYRFHCKGWGKESPTAAWVRSLPYPPILVVLEAAEEMPVTLAGRRVVRASDLAETKWIKRFRRTVINKKLRDNCPRAWDQLTNPEGCGI
jgi:hypothetical protein